MESYKKKMAAYKKTDNYKKFKMSKKMKKLVKKPKRPASAYFLFLMDVRADLVKKNPSWGVAETGKAIGKMWANLGDSGKAKYLAKAQKAKEKYDGVLARYKQSAKFKAYQGELAEWKEKCKAAKKAAKAELKGEKTKT